MSTKFVMCLLILGCCLLSEAQGFCSLDKMRTYAIEACERLFQQDEGRERRSIGNHIGMHHINELSHDKMHKDRHLIGRSTYPNGGYLKVGRDHYHRLIRLDVQPRYKPRKHHQDKKLRFRRDNSGKHYNNISYCCYNQCKEDFFC